MPLKIKKSLSKKLSRFKLKPSRIIEPIPLERDICKMFFKTIQQMVTFNLIGKNFLLFHIANEQIGNRNYIIGLKRMGLTPGVADYCVLLEGGRVAFIEFKRDLKAKMSEAQLAFKAKCEELNIPFLCTTQIDEGINFIKRLL